MNAEARYNRIKNPDFYKAGLTQKKYSLHLDRVSLPVYDFENDDVISLNVDGSQDEKSDDDEQHPSLEQQQDDDEEDEDDENSNKYELLKCKLSKNIANNNNSSQLDSGCDTFKFELNPQKYSLELSTLSSSSSSSSSSSFSSLSLSLSLNNCKDGKDVSSNSLNSNLSK